MMANVYTGKSPGKQFTYRMWFDKGGPVWQWVIEIADAISGEVVDYQFANGTREEVDVEAQIETHLMEQRQRWTPALHAVVSSR